jgi:hypothetical protein
LIQKRLDWEWFLRREQPITLQLIVGGTLIILGVLISMREAAPQMEKISIQSQE